MNEIDPLEEVLQHLSGQTPVPPRETQIRAEFLSAVRLVSSKNHHQPQPRKQGGKLMRLIFATAAAVIVTVLALAGNQFMDVDDRVAQEPIGQVPEQTDPEIMYWNVAIEDLILLSDFDLLVPEELPADYVFEFGSYREGGKTIEMDYSCRSSGGFFSFIQQTEPIDFIPLSDDDFVQEIEIRTPERQRITGHYIIGEWNESTFQLYSNENGHGMIGWYNNDEVAAYQSLIWSDEETGIYYQLITSNTPHYQDYSSCHLSREDLIAFAWNLEVADANDYPPSTIVLDPQLFTRYERDILPADYPRPDNALITGLTREEAEELAGYPLPEIPNTYYRFQEAQFDEANERVTLVYEFGGTKTVTLLLHMQPIRLPSDTEMPFHDLIGAHALVRYVELEHESGEYIHGTWADENTPYTPPGWLPQWMNYVQAQRLRWQRGGLIYELERAREDFYTSSDATNILTTVANQIIEAQGNERVGLFWEPAEETMPVETSSTVLGQAIADATFPVLLPQSLPEGFSFVRGSTFNARISRASNIFLQYQCAWGNLFLNENFHVSPDDRLDLPEIGIDSEYETVEIGEGQGSYVRGQWMSNLSVFQLKPGEHLFVAEVWDSNQPTQTLVWRANGVNYQLELWEVPGVQNAANYTDECQPTKEELVAIAESLVPSEQLGVQPSAFITPAEYFLRSVANDRALAIPTPTSRESFLAQAVDLDPAQERSQLEEILGYEFPLPGYIPSNFVPYMMRYHPNGRINIGYYDPENYTHRLYIHIQPADQEIDDPENPSGFDLIGANTAIQQVQIGDLAGEYVAGDWRVDTRDSNLTPISDGYYNAVWMPDIQWQRLRWEQDGVLIEIETGDKTTLTLESPVAFDELIRIAESFSAE